MINLPYCVLFWQKWTTSGEAGQHGGTVSSRERYKEMLLRHDSIKESKWKERQMRHGDTDLKTEMKKMRKYGRES